MPDFKWHRYPGLACPINGRPAKHVSFREQKLHVVESWR